MRRIYWEPLDAGPHSPAVQIVRIVAEHANETNGRTRTSTGAAIRRAIVLTIEGGIRWDRDDVAKMGTLWGTRHTGASFPDPDRLHALAVENRNTSAAVAVEHAAGRPPAWHPETGRRLHVGATFRREGLTVEVTGFTAETLTACAFDGPRGYGRKVVRRFRVPLKELRKPRRSKEGE